MVFAIRVNGYRWDGICRVNIRVVIFQLIVYIYIDIRTWSINFNIKYLTIPSGNVHPGAWRGNSASVITIIRWMFRGKKDPFLVFPRAGIRQEDIDGAARFGPIIAEHVKKGTIAELNPALLATGAARIAPTLLILERRALFVFGKWRRFILAKADRDPSSRIRRVKFFSRALPVLIFIVSPISGLSVRLMGLLRGARLRAEIARILTY